MHTLGDVAWEPLGYNLTCVGAWSTIMLDHDPQV